jgi:cytochrome c oxidase subunit 3
MILFMMFVWWRDIIREGTFEGQHTSTVQLGLRMGMLLFIVSEIMFFFAFFWAFFHSSFNPSIALGGVWPPAFLTILDPWKVPLLNTVILLTSGATVTWAHHAIVWGSKENASWALINTVILAIIFTGFQLFEYKNTPFTAEDSVYGSIFFLTTGFHGLHVIIGTIFLLFAGYQQFKYSVTTITNVSIKFANIYWHFVDAIWIGLYLLYYYYITLR